MESISIIGFIAAICTTAAFIPQVCQVWVSRSAKDISIAMYLIFMTGVALWLVYGLIIKDSPLIVANLITLVLAGAVLTMKLYFERNGATTN